MNELNVIRRNGVEVVDSRDVARAVEKQHKNLLADIRWYIEAMEDSGELKIQPSEFFIPSTYINSQNKEQPCYLLTKKGCDMVANKMTGEKGVLFTAAYVTAFEKMRERIQKNQLPPDKAALAEAKAKNARARVASLWLKLAKENPIPEYKAICAHYASAELAGGTAVLPLPEVTERTYTAAEVGELLGGVSANMVGRMANQNGLKTPGYGKQVWDKSPHSSKQVQSWRYNDKAVARLRELFGGGAA